MAFSQTVSQTTFDTSKIITSAFRRCRLPAQQLSAETIDIANNELYLLLSQLANQGVPLWCVLKVIQPLYAGVTDATLPLGVVDVLNGLFRTVSGLSGTDVDTSTTHTTTFSSTTAVSTVGVLWADEAVPLALERSDDGATWTTIQSETPVAIAGEWTWYDLSSSVAALYFRVRATSGVLSFSQVYLANNPTEIPLARMNRDDYTSLPNKAFQSSRPLQYWFDRQTPYPVMHLWPTPNAAATVSQLVLWVHRHIMDVGTLTQEVEVPQRWYDAIVAGLAKRLAREIVEVDPGRIPMLDADAAEALAIAQNEERDNSPTNWTPNISYYTA